MSDVTTPVDTATSTTDAPAATAEQPAATDTQAVEAPADQTDAETSILGGDVKDEAPADTETDAPEHVVPEAYELALEGVELDAAALEAATPVFKELNLSNDQANKLMPVAKQFGDTIAERTVQQIVDAGAQQKAAWAEAAKADPEIGGAKFEETTHLAAKALDYLGYPEGSEFRQALTETGFGNHPEMIRAMRKIGAMVSEDGFARSDAGSTQAVPIEKRLYPND